LISLAAFPAGCLAQVPKVGDSLKIEIANWNLEWFGKAGYGPSDEGLQQANVLQVIKNADIDIWTFCEVSDVTVFDSMMARLPEYGYTICTYQPEQKTAVIYKKKQFQLIRSELVGTGNPDSFTTQRFPFHVALKSLIPGGIDTLHLLAIHLKANFGNSSELLAAYNSRLRSAEWLKMYFDKTQGNNYCIVLGDWNDDLDESIYNSLPSPYANMLDTDFKFSFITRKFTDAHLGTTTSYPDAIDHQLISARLQDYYIANSTKLFYLNQYITNYGSTTSDHYPVYSSFARNSNSVYINPLNNKFYLYPNPASNSFNLNFNGSKENMIVKITDMAGKCMMEKYCGTNEEISVGHLPDGCYHVLIIDNNKIYSTTLEVAR
jgi:hypothetical protein